MTRRFWTLLATTGAIALSSLILGKEPAQSQTSIQVAQTDRWTRQVRDQLNQVARSARDRGATLTHDPYTGVLGNGGRDDINLNLRNGTTYAIVGVCDNDCRDIDLALYDDNGNLIASDTEQDSTPIVNVTPRWNARFRLRVSMPRCSSAPCAYGVGVFGR